MVEEEIEAMRNHDRNCEILTAWIGRENNGKSLLNSNHAVMSIMTNVTNITTLSRLLNLHSRAKSKATNIKTRRSLDQICIHAHQQPIG